ncbi:MAG: hypothetical protein WDN23_16810 [Edaphobacter sp.]
MGGSGRGKAADVVFEGVLIPKDSRSAKLASNGIATVDEMGDFLTAVFADTLNGKIVLPPRRAKRVPAKVLEGMGRKMKALPLKMQGRI